MSNFDDYITDSDKPFAENINDALLLSNVFDLTVPIQVPTMFRDSTWVDVTSSRKCGVAILTLKESLPAGVSISTVDGKSVLTGTGTVKLGFYPNFNSFGSFKSIDWEETGTVQINLKTVDNTTIASNISKGLIQNPTPALMTLQEIVLEIVLNNGTLKSLDIVMENKQQERYGAECGISNVNGLQSNLDAKVNVSDVKNNLVSTDTNKPLSAYMGKILQDSKSSNNHTHDNRYFTETEIGTWTSVEVTGATSYATLEVNEALRLALFKYYRQNYNFTNTSDVTLHENAIPSDYRPSTTIVGACFNPNVGLTVSEWGVISAVSIQAGAKTINATAMWHY